jgi:FKBP-type peptidyl-prolyl cis-trans isomerase SlyD
MQKKHAPKKLARIKKPKVVKDSVVAFNYVMKNSKGRIVSQTGPDEVIEYIHGHQQIIPGLEELMKNKSIGYRFKGVIKPEKAYGNKPPKKELRKHAYFYDLAKAKMAGTALTTGTEIGLLDKKDNEHLFYVVCVNQNTAVLSDIHPLAGVELAVEGRITNIRKTESKEIKTGELESI